MGNTERTIRRWLQAVSHRRVYGQWALIVGAFLAVRWLPEQLPHPAQIGLMLLTCIGSYRLIWKQAPTVPETKTPTTSPPGVDDLHSLEAAAQSRARKAAARLRLLWTLPFVVLIFATVPSFARSSAGAQWTWQYWGLWVLGLMLAVGGARYLVEGRLMKSATRARQIVRDIGATRRLRERLLGPLKLSVDRRAQPAHADPPQGETVYLRPFALANLLTWTHHEDESRTVATLETQLSSAIAPGSLLAVGDAGPDDASAHILSDDAAWKDHVRAALVGAARIVVVPWPSPGVLWELGFLRQEGMLSRCIFVMPPPLEAHPGSAIADRWEEVRGHARSIGLEFPRYSASGCLFALTGDGALHRSEPFWVHDVGELSRSMKVLVAAPAGSEDQRGHGRAIRCRTPAHLRWRNKMLAAFLASLGSTLVGLADLLGARFPSIGGAVEAFGVYLLAMVVLAVLLRDDGWGRWSVFVYVGLLSILILGGLLCGRQNRSASPSLSHELAQAAPWMLLGGGLALAGTVLFALWLLRGPCWAVLGDDVRVVAPLGHSRRSPWSEVLGIIALSTRCPGPYELSFRDGETISFTPSARDDGRFRDLVRRYGVAFEPPFNSR